ncbi:hypothetical protein DPX16_22895 [Anabarilius grahami]|uniref:Uncharacterized protein n=1 Tax=Anabarilius grahami TaxID=495550 RepID=A0A3N0XMB3_ANAGA|nr:hypothetical protein DPX16_22895 [Anabarilius grahami]
MEYVLGQRIRRRRERVYRPRQTYLSLSEEECIRKLRLTRQAVTDICHLLADELGTDAQCPYAFPVAVKSHDSFILANSSCHLRGESPVGWVAVRGQRVSVKDMAVDTIFDASNNS